MDVTDIGEEEEMAVDSSSDGETTISSGTDDGEANDWEGPREVQVGGSPSYKVKRKLGAGGYGQVFLGRRASGSDGAGPKKVALKFEHIVTDRTQYGPHEWQVYCALRGCQGVPKAYYFGQQGEYYVLIMEILGTSLSQVWRESPGKSLSSEMVGCIAVESLSILEDMHARGYAHGDIKPENLMLGPPSTPLEKKLFFVDMGLARKLTDNKSGGHVEYDQCPGMFRGSHRYASVHAHLGRTYSRRDDLESLAYTLIFLHRGRLPWMHYLEDKVFIVGKSKRTCSLETLFGPHPLRPLREFFEIVIGMKFDEEPKYSKFISLFESLLGADPGSRSLNTDAAQKALERFRKRTRDEEDVERPRKLIRLGTPQTQWLAVYNDRLPIRQRYYCDVPDERLATHINSGTRDGLRISCVASHSNLWAIIMESETSFYSQIYHVFPPEDLNKDWISVQWNRNYEITSLAGAEQGNALVVMSQGSPYKDQCFDEFKRFPYRWIANRWVQGYFVTSMGTIGNRWAIVMSKGSGYLQQAISLDYRYPFEGTRIRSRKGFRITSIAATSDQVAVIMSLPWHRSDNGMQHVSRSNSFPKESIEERRKTNCYVSYLCFGPTVVRPSEESGSTRNRL